MTTEERRAPGAMRIPFDALVEVGGALGPTFEAQAVNISEEGIQLRTAYLPEPGQPLTCRFDGGPGQAVIAAGEVAWAQSGDRGGEFGVRFTEIDAGGVDALKRICGLSPQGTRQGAQGTPRAQAGARVRLHIDGLASPMRAKIKDALPSAVTVGSDLAFLQVGRQLELEDAQSGARRPANIDRVDVAVDPSSHVPQLVVTLRYAESAARGAAPGARPPSLSRPADDDMSAVESASLAMKGALTRAMQAIGPAFGRVAELAKRTVAGLAPRPTRASGASAARRTTAPAPGGGLRAAGRRVVRGDASVPDRDEPRPVPGLPLTGRRAAVAAGVMAAAILGALALKKTHPDPAAAHAAAAASSSPATAASSSAALPPATPGASSAAAGENDADDAERARSKRIHVAPFASGPVHHGNVLRLKMDGPIETIEGAAQPTGFAVKIPGRKSLEAAAPLAARDARIAAIKVTNGSSGADLTVAFKDGVPTYRVSARGDTLVIALAAPGAVDGAVAKKGAARLLQTNRHQQ